MRTHRIGYPKTVMPAVGNPGEDGFVPGYTVLAYEVVIPFSDDEEQERDSQEEASWVAKSAVRSRQAELDRLRAQLLDDTISDADVRKFQRMKEGADG